MLQLNINGIRNKSVELQQLMSEENIDIALIQETRLHPSTKTPTIPNYSFTRHVQHQPNPKPTAAASSPTSKKTYPAPTQHPHTSRSRVPNHHSTYNQNEKPCHHQPIPTTEERHYQPPNRRPP